MDKESYYDSIHKQKGRPSDRRPVVLNWSSRDTRRTQFSRGRWLIFQSFTDIDSNLSRVLDGSVIKKPAHPTLLRTVDRSWIRTQVLCFPGVYPLEVVSLFNVCTPRDIWFIRVSEYFSLYGPRLPTVYVPGRIRNSFSPMTVTPSISVSPIIRSVLNHRVITHTPLTHQLLSKRRILCTCVGVLQV